MLEYSNQNKANLTDKEVQKIRLSLFDDDKNQEKTMTLEEVSSMVNRMDKMFRQVSERLSATTNYVFDLGDIISRDSKQILALKTDFSVLKRDMNQIRVQIDSCLYPDKLLEIADAAELVNLSESRLYQLVQERKIPFQKSSGKLWFRTSELNKWLDNGRNFS